MMKSLQITVLLVLLSTLFACSSNDSADAGNESKLLSNRSTEIEIYFPTNPLRYINNKVAEGEWTIEQGLITALKYSAGDKVTQKRYPADPEDKGGREWSDIISLAQHYIAHGKDDKAKAEIQRLLDKQYIDIEELEKWSRPAGENSGAARKQVQSPSNAFVDYLVSPAKAQTGSSDTCQSIWASIVQRVDGPTGHCFDVDEWSHRGAHLRVFYPTLWRDDPIQLGWVAATKEAINDSIDKYSGDLGLIGGVIDLVFYTAGRSTGDFVYYADAIDTDPAGSRSVCYVRVFPESFSIVSAYQDNNISNYKQTIAHEIFHCYQYSNFKAQAVGSTTLNTSSDTVALSTFIGATAWWIEGSAEYFGNVVYPCNQSEFIRLSDWDNNSSTMSLVDMEYENVVFFMYLSSKWGTGTVIHFLRALPVRGDKSDQLKVLNGYPMGRKFQLFGQDYLAMNVSDTCRGVQLPIKAPMDEFDVCRGCEEELIIDSFQLARRILVFRPGHSELEYQHGDTPVRKSASENLSAWENAPEVINAGCREPPFFHTLFIHDDWNARDKKLVIKELSEGEPDRTHHIDSCLIGKWNATQDSVENIADWIAANPLTRKSMHTMSEQTSGGFSGTFSRNGVVTGNMNSLTQEYSSEVKIGKKALTMGTKVVINGASRAEYSAKGNMLKVWDACGENSARAISELDGKVMSDKVIDLSKFSDMGTVDGIRRQKNTDKSNDAYSPLVNAAEIIPLDWEFRYRCQGDSLEIDPPAQLKGRPPWEFNRGSDS